MIISLIPGVTTLSPFLIVLPVIFIIVVNMLREGGEDLLRFLNDRKVNRKNAFVYRDGEICRVDTRHVRVGDIVKVEEDQAFPADILLLGSSQEDGSCKIETSNLDGETSLKPRYAPKLAQLYNSVEQLQNLKGMIKCQNPNEQLYKFKGSIKVNDVEVPLSHQNLLLKGSILATEFIYGVVIYTGHDTKVMKNMNKPKVKFSFVNKMLNSIIAVMFTIQILFCICFTGVGSYLEFTVARVSPYGKPRGWSDAVYVVMSFMSFIILFAHFIPVSLLVSFELVKLVQAWFISMDNEMRIIDTQPHNPDKKRFVSSVSIASDLNSDLSQIDMIFSDKTGTLTENSMVFKKCCAGYDLIHDDFAHKGNMGRMIEIVKDYHKTSLKSSENSEEQQKEINNIILSNSQGLIHSEDQFFSAVNTLLIMSLCHNVNLRKKIHKEPKGEESTTTFFEGESVDEVALVLGAINNQFSVTFSSEKKTILKIFEKDYTFNRVSEIPFTPERKRMSTLFNIPLEFLQDFPIFTKKVQQMKCQIDEEGVLICLSKGADSFLYPLIESANASQMQQKMDEQSTHFAREGLRTLLLAFKFVERSAFDEWNTRYNASKSLLSKARKQVIEKTESEMEKNLHIVGCTAVEDTLQQGVPETIQFFLDSGMQLWMLTGDKRETAVKTAGLANFLNEKTIVYTLDGDNGSITSCETCSKVISEHLNAIQLLSHEQANNVALVMDGHAFAHCLEANVVPLFIEMIKRCKTVIFCRSTPKQKSQLVLFAKNRLKKSVLSVGDGVNDGKFILEYFLNHETVPMIQKARVGVGIIGKEGNQAKMSSDFAIPKFRMLKRLIAVHGRYSYKRTSNFIHYYIYKNLGIAFVQILYSFYSMYSGQTLSENYVITFTNLIFTLMNPFSFGIFEKDISEKYLEDSKIGPKLLASLRKENVFNVYTFFKWIGGGILHVTMVFFICIYATEISTLTNGKEDGLWMKSVLVSSCVFSVVNLKCFLEFEFITGFHIFAMLFSFLTYYGFNLIYAAFGTSTLFNVWYEAGKSPIFWFTHLLCWVSTLGLDYALHALKAIFYPDLYQVVKKNGVKHEIKSVVGP